MVVKHVEIRLEKKTKSVTHHVNNKRGTKANYQDELREIPANFDERRTGVSPHVLYTPGPRQLK